MRFLILFFSSGAGSGYIPFMPGTAGSIIGLFLFLLFHTLSVPIYFITLIAFTFFSIWVSGRAEAIYGKKDDRRIVIDEIVGMLVSLFLIPAKLKFLLAGFILFRFFDIAKIYPANVVQRGLNGGVAVVFDDIIAGVYTNLSLNLIRVWL